MGLSLADLSLLPARGPDPPVRARLHARGRRCAGPGGRGPRGVPGAGGGSPAYLPVPLEWRATTRQVCGLFPWSAPGQLPLLGVPIGRHQHTGAVVCFDHVNWFLGNRIANPSVLIIARPGLGKSTLAAKMMLGLSAQGYALLVPGDTKPDYVELTRVLGGQVREVRRAGGAALNPCDPGGMSAAAHRIGGQRRRAAALRGGRPGHGRRSPG